MAAVSGPTILVVDDDQTILDFLKAVLRREGYGDVWTAKNGNEAIDIAVQHSPDLIILDLWLPELTGLQVCRDLRAWYHSPILILSGHGDEDVIVEALDAGADDYLTKPMRPRELTARIRSLLRRSSEQSADRPVITAGNLQIDLARRRVFPAGKEVKLTRMEFDILAYLCANQNCVVTLKMLMDHIWGPTHGDYSQTLRVHIGHIRKKIEPDHSQPVYILTESGIGYRFSSPAEDSPSTERSA